MTVFVLVYMISIEAPLFRLDFNTMAACEHARIEMLHKVGGAYGVGRSVCLKDVRPQ